VYADEAIYIPRHCHEGLTGGHHGASIRTKKVYDSCFFCPMINKDVCEFVKRCDRCQCIGNISSKNGIPQNAIQACEVFDSWGIDFIGPFPMFKGNSYILVVVDYVSKWVEAQALPTNDAWVVVKFLKKLVTRFGNLQSIE
jgi:hypothetical protein